MPFADKNSLHIPYPAWAKDGDVEGGERDFENWKELQRWADRQPTPEPPSGGGSVPVFRFESTLNPLAGNLDITESVNYGDAVALMAGGGFGGGDAVEILQAGVYRISIQFWHRIFDPPAGTTAAASVSLVDAVTGGDFSHSPLLTPWFFVAASGLIDAAGSATNIVRLQAGDRIGAFAGIEVVDGGTGGITISYLPVDLAGELLWPDESVVSDFVPSVG